MTTAVNSPVMGLQESLAEAALRQPGQAAITFLPDDGLQPITLTWSELHAECLAWGARLQSQGAAGQNVLLLFPPGLHYVLAFLACQYAGATAVPVYAPSNPDAWARISGIARDCQAEFALTTAALQHKIGEFADPHSLEGVKWLHLDRQEVTAGPWAPLGTVPDGISFLQYTSGSTGDPKGVMVSHANVLHNARMIRDSFGTHRGSCCVTWLPPYHDMGLIGCILQPLLTGYPVVLMSPFHFVQRPLRWLQAISAYGGTTCGGPDFAYALCVRKVREEDCQGLDLSSWRVAFSGGEPVRKETLDAFAAKFSRFGFSSDAFMPCYGLAEATLFVTGRRPGTPLLTLKADLARLAEGLWTPATGDAAPAVLVSAGKPQPDTQLHILGPDGAVLPPGQVGEVAVSGPSVTQGYWGKPALSAEAFRPMAEGGHACLRTGDLGFLLEGELFITGRIKDLIILNGKNIYPQDVEQEAERASACVVAQGCAAFGVPDASGKETLALVCEVARGTSQAQLEEAASAIRQRVWQLTGFSPSTVRFIPLRTLPKTSSGKVRRSHTRHLLLTGQLKPYPPQSPTHGIA